MTKPFSQASKNNRKPILDTLVKYFAHQHKILEIGTGTGQHAVYFSQYLAHLTWETSDRELNHKGINQWIDDFTGGNLERPLELDVENPDNWNDLVKLQSICPVDGVFTANTVHIMPWISVQKMFFGVEKLFSISAERSENASGRFVVYGPFNREGKFTSPGNAAFHQQLLESNSLMGIRDDRDVFELAAKNSLKLVDDIDMPANNRTLVFEYSKSR